MCRLADTRGSCCSTSAGSPLLTAPATSPSALYAWQEEQDNSSTAVWCLNTQCYFKQNPFFAVLRWEECGDVNMHKDMQLQVVNECVQQ